MESPEGRSFPLLLSGKPVLQKVVFRMRHTNDYSGSFGPATDPVAEARMRVRVSYLLSQWVQAPITDWREADT
jgi:hypothetical protein